jgi:hypothetical protein
MTKIIEFKNQQDETLRGLLDEAQSDLGIVFVHGFERTTVEAKFKNIVDALKGRANMFRFDFSGSGLSDGNFEDLTVNTLARDLKTAVATFQAACPIIKKINFVAHSLGAAIVLKFLVEEKKTDSKAIFLAPGFNQKELMKYWFVQSRMKKEKVEINWVSFRDYFSEEDFQTDLKIEKRLTKEHYLKNNYFLENEKADFQELLNRLSASNFLIIHGDADESVPFESNNSLPKEIKIIKVAKGNHDLQRPNMVEQYLSTTIDFLIS